MIIQKMATDAEIKGKAYVHWKSWQEAYPGIVARSYLNRLTLEKCQSIAVQWPDNILVAKDGSNVVGFAGYGKYRNDELPNTGEVFSLYVLSAYYGQGVGCRLMQEALKQLIAYPQVAVWVLKENQRAIRFYEKCGFRFDGREESILLDTPVAEIRMILSR
ncbi:MAG: GNAT family N-acetyltransferase [Clostridia bacterium]|nr:GNAT family N-acetyltransferase [Clostridia bacterium]